MKKSRKNAKALIAHLFPEPTEPGDFLLVFRSGSTPAPDRANGTYYLNKHEISEFESKIVQSERIDIIRALHSLHNHSDPDMSGRVVGFM